MLDYAVQKTSRTIAQLFRTIAQTRVGIAVFVVDWVVRLPPFIHELRTGGAQLSVDDTKATNDRDVLDRPPVIKEPFESKELLGEGLRPTAVTVAGLVAWHPSTIPLPLERIDAEVGKILEWLPGHPDTKADRIAVLAITWSRGAIFAQIPQAIDSDKLTSCCEPVPVKTKNALRLLVLAIEEEDRPSSATERFATNDAIKSCIHLTCPATGIYGQYLIRRDITATRAKGDKRDLFLALLSLVDEATCRTSDCHLEAAVMSKGRATGCRLFAAFCVAEPMGKFPQLLMVDD